MSAPLDPGLRAFVEAADPEEAERHLGAILEETVAPLARAIVARKCFAHGGLAPADVEDVVGDVLLALVGRLQTLREDKVAAPIASLEDFTATVSYHAFAHHLRRRHPGRSLLKGRLRYHLSREGRFGLWSTPEGTACGFKSWRGTPISRGAERKLEAVPTDPGKWQAFTREAAAVGRDPGRLLAALLEEAGGPVDLDRLVGTVTALLPEAAVEPAGSSSPEAVPDRALVPADVLLHRREVTGRLWSEIGALPVRQRIALLLSLRDRRGSSLLWVLPVTGTASVRQIARVLEMPDEELAEMWNRLPLDDLQLAERLGCARQQVINLRSAARKRLARRMGDDGGDGEGARPAGNTGPLLASLGDER